MTTWHPDAARRAILDGTAPDGMRVDGSLDFFQRHALTSLPKGLHVDGSLYIRKCPSLMTLPEGLVVDYSLYLNDCPALTSLPADMRIRGMIEFTGCPGLSRYLLGTDRRGYDFYLITPRDGPYIIAGCRKLTVADAKLHWAENPEALAFVQEAERRLAAAATTLHHS